MGAAVRPQLVVTYSLKKDQLFVDDKFTFFEFCFDGAVF
jgi:hypothetical protein